MKTILMIMITTMAIVFLSDLSHKNVGWAIFDYAVICALCSSVIILDSKFEEGQ